MTFVSPGDVLMLCYAMLCHEVPVEPYADLVRVVDVDGKPVKPGAAAAGGGRLFPPTSVPEGEWRRRLGGEWAAKL